MNSVGAKLRMSAPESRRVRRREPSRRFLPSAYNFHTLRQSKTSSTTNSRKTRIERAVNRKMPLLLRGFRKCRLKALRAISRIAARHRQPASRTTVTRRLRNTRLLPEGAGRCANPAIIGVSWFLSGGRFIGLVARFIDVGLHFPASCGILVNAMIHAKLTQLALPFSLAGLLLVAGCNKNQPPQNAEQPAASQPVTPAPSSPASGQIG